MGDLFEQAKSPKLYPGRSAPAPVAETGYLTLHDEGPMTWGFVAQRSRRHAGQQERWRVLHPLVVLLHPDPQDVVRHLRVSRLPAGVRDEVAPTPAGHAGEEFLLEIALRDPEAV